MIFWKLSPFADGCRDRITTAIERAVSACVGAHGIPDVQDCEIDPMQVQSCPAVANSQTAPKPEPQFASLK